MSSARDCVMNLDSSPRGATHRALPSRQQSLLRSLELGLELELTRESQKSELTREKSFLMVAVPILSLRRAAVLANFVGVTMRTEG